MKDVKKIAGAIFLLVLIACFAACSSIRQSTYVDAYTSATEQTSKTWLTADAIAAVAKVLEAGSSDLASLEKTKTTGYAAPKSFTVHVMSTNPDGSVGISTITQWKYTDSKEGADKVTVQLTYGQNAMNLCAVGNRGTLFIPGVAVNGVNGKYLIHLKAIAVDVLNYSDEAFNAGKFNSYYSGKAAQKTQYTITCEVLGIEEVSASVKLGLAFN